MEITSLHVAQEVFEKLSKEGSNLWELRLLKAEITAKDGDLNAAITALESLVEEQETPMWIKDIAKALLDQIPRGK